MCDASRLSSGSTSMGGALAVDARRVRKRTLTGPQTPVDVEPYLSLRNKRLHLEHVSTTPFVPPPTGAASGRRQLQRVRERGHAGGHRRGHPHAGLRVRLHGGLRGRDAAGRPLLRRGERQFPGAGAAAPRRADRPAADGRAAAPGPPGGADGGGHDGLQRGEQSAGRGGEAAPAGGVGAHRGVTRCGERRGAERRRENFEALFCGRGHMLGEMWELG